MTARYLQIEETKYLTITELSTFFGVSTYRLKKDLKEIKDRLPNFGKGRPYTPKEVQIIKRYILEGI